MNNKPIIIDGVDVSECESFSKVQTQVAVEYNCVQKYLIRPCNINPNCYYKQLQQEKIENKQLKEDLTALQQTYEACEKEYNALAKRYHKLQEVLNAK